MYLNQIIVKSLLVLSSLVVLSSAQDSGDGFIFNCKSPGQVALTFDDGPSPENTPNLLNILGTKGIKATFFVLTVNINEANGKAILKQTFDAGHQIALHSSTHANMNTLTEDGVRQEYSKNLDAVKTTIGKTPNYARPPYGNCKTSCSNVMKELGLTVTQWSADSQDWQYVNAVEKQPSMVSNVLNTIAKGNPATNSFITLQHDIHKFSVDNTPKIIDGIAKLGYKFVTVSECMDNSPPAYKEDGVVGVNSTTTQVTPQQTIASVPASPSSLSSSSSLPTAKSTGVPKANSSSGASKSTSATTTIAKTTPTTAADQSSADKVIVSSNIFGISLLIVSIIVSFLG